jgi:hypothetical protein
MSTVSELIDTIYRLSDAYKFEQLNAQLEEAFDQWCSENKWSEISSVLFSLDIEKIKKRSAEIILEHLRDDRKNIACYKQFWQTAMDVFGGDEIKLMR